MVAWHYMVVIYNKWIKTWPEKRKQELEQSTVL